MVSRLPSPLFLFELNSPYHHTPLLQLQDGILKDISGDTSIEFDLAEQSNDAHKPKYSWFGKMRSGLHFHLFLAGGEYLKPEHRRTMQFLGYVRFGKVPHNLDLQYIVYAKKEKDA